MQLVLMLEEASQAAQVDHGAERTLSAKPPEME